jgi:hypothetical protein
METALTVVGSVAVAFITAWIRTVVKLRREHELDIDKNYGMHGLTRTRSRGAI